MDPSSIPVRTSSLNPATSGRQQPQLGQRSEYAGGPGTLSRRDPLRSETFMDLLHNEGLDSSSMSFTARTLADGLEDLEGQPDISAAATAHPSRGMPGGLRGLERKRRLTHSEDQGTSRSGHVVGNGPNSRMASGEQTFGSASLRISSPIIPRTVIDLTESPPRRPSTSQMSDRVGGIILPRWQPDSEVQRCPVCGTQFSFWYRKHHCRKCGRVVCANCSPHRITIPRQFIVHPPYPTSISAVQRSSGSDVSGETGGDHVVFQSRNAGASNASSMNPALGGGEEVRVCNPCVPDPNFDPPPQRSPFRGSPSRLTPFPTFSPVVQSTMQSQPAFPALEQGSRRFRQYSFDGVCRTPEVMHPFQRSARRPSINDAGIPRPPYCRPFLSDSMWTTNPDGLAPSRQELRTRQRPVVFKNRPRSPTLTPLTPPPRRNSLVPSAVSDLSSLPQSHRRPEAGRLWTLQAFRPGPVVNVPSGLRSPAASSSLQHQRGSSLPGPPSPVLPFLGPHEPSRRAKEDDECPVCGCDLPARGPDGSETAREEHIELCIRTHFSRPTYGPIAAANASDPAVPSSAPPERPVIPRAARVPPMSSARHLVPGQEQYQGQQQAYPQPQQQRNEQQQEPQQQRPQRATGNRMLVYRATEKDCVGEDGEQQECVICFEEFEVGDEMGRLECLCKFHRACIRQWWETKGAGSCPTHQLHE